MALATLQLAAIPVLAGLAAGTGAVATYVAAPNAPAAASQTVPCSAQTWPYVAQACIAAVAPEAPRKVRIVTAPRPAELFNARWTDVPPAATPGVLEPAFPGMTTSDGVLRGPQATKPAPDTPARAKRSEAKPEKRKRIEARAASQPYQVPAERSGGTREVYVLKPLRLDAFR